MINSVCGFYGCGIDHARHDDGINQYAAVTDPERDVLSLLQATDDMMRKD